MMTKTSLSPATGTCPGAHRVYSAPQSRMQDSSLARAAASIQWHRHSCLCAVAKPSAQQVATAVLLLPLKFLIANDDPSRIVILSEQRGSKIPSCLPLQSAPAELTSSRFLIDGTAIKIHDNTHHFSLLRISNRQQNASLP